MGNNISDGSNVSVPQQYIISFGESGITAKSLEQLHPGFSTLSPSEQEAVINLYAAATPSLQPPLVMTLSSKELSSLAGAVSQAQDEIINNMLQAWSVSVQQQAEESKKFYNSPEHQRDLERTSNATLSNQDHVQRETQVQFVTGSDPSITLSSPNEQSRLKIHTEQDSANMEINPLAVETVLGGGVAIHTTIAINSTPTVGVDPLKDAWNQVVQPNMQDPNSAMILSQLGALMVNLVDYSNLQSIGQSIRAKQPVSDAQTAKNFAQNVIATVQSPQFATYLQSIVIMNMDPTKPIDNKEVSRQVALATTALLVRALAALNIVATKNYDGGEILKMIKGEIILPEGPEGSANAQMATLITMIRNQLESGMISGADQASLLTNLAAYIDTKPSITDLTMSGSVFRNAMPPNPMEEDLLSEQPT